MRPVPTSIEVATLPSSKRSSVAGAISQRAACAARSGREVERRVDVVAADLPGGLALVLRVAERLEVADVLHHVVAEELGVPVGGVAPLCGGVRVTNSSSTGIAMASACSACVMIPSASIESRMTSRRPWLASKLSGLSSGGAPGLLHDRDEARGLGDRDVGGRDAVVLLGGRLDAVGVAAEARDVEVRQQDLVLGVLLLEADGELRLFQLALEGRAPAPAR